MSGGAPPPTPQHRAARAARAWNVHRLVGLRVTPLARLAPLRVERPEVHQRDLVAVCNRLNNDVQRCRARRCATLGARVGQDGTRASQSSAVQTGQAHELWWRGVQAGWASCCWIGSRGDRGASSWCDAPALSTSSAVFFETPALSEIASTSWPLETPDLLAPSPSAPSALCMRICAADARSAVDSGCRATGRCMH